MVTLQALRGQAILGAFRDPGFRWLWLAGLGTSATFQMSAVAQGWLVYDLSGSAQVLAWVAAGMSIAMLVFALFGGVWSDRVARRSLLLLTKTGMLLNALALAVVISTGAVRIWQMAASSFFMGVMFAFTMPAQQAIVADLVDERTLLNAYALNSIGMGLAAIFAASLAGMMIESLGVASVYYAMAAIYTLALLALKQLPTAGVARGSAGSVWADLADGLAYLLRNPTVVALMGLALSMVLFAIPYQTFMPKFAEDVMRFDASGLGLLITAIGIGSLLSSLIMAALGDYRAKGRMMLGAGVASGLGLVLFVGTARRVVVFPSLALVGGAGNVVMVTIQALLLTCCEPSYRGRVMSVWMLLWGLSPLGTVPAGILADRLGVPWVVSLQGIALSVVFLGMGLLRPQVRRLE